MINLHENEVSIIRLRGFSTEYHFLVVTSYDTNNFMIYSYYGNDFINPFKVDKILFLFNFNKLQSGNVDTNYKKKVSNTEIYKVWKFLTRIDLQKVLNNDYKLYINRHSVTDDESSITEYESSTTEYESSSIEDESSSIENASSNQNNKSKLWKGYVADYQIQNNFDSIEIYKIDCNKKPKTKLIKLKSKSSDIYQIASDNDNLFHNKRSKKGEKKSRRKKTKTRKRSKSKRQSPFRETI